MTKITAIIPTLNEEIHIADAIASVKFADEIIVIDSFSTDKTIEIAEKLNVKIIKRKFDDFSSQKNFAIDQAKHPWIYILDADERVTPEVEKEILKAVKDPKDYVGFYVKRTYYFSGKKVNYSGFQRDKVIRLFLKEFCRYNGNLVHETITAKGKLGFFKHKIDHYSYRNYDHYISKMNHYGALKAKQLHDEGKKVNLFHILIKPPVRFFIHYIVRLGFLDGFTGFMFAKTQAYGVLTRYIKLWLLNKKKNTSVIENNDDIVVDAVITWVDGNDAVHKAKMANYIENKSSLNNKSVRMRYDQVNEIEFAVKSILKNAKFVRNIFIVTDNQIPEFLKDTEKAKIDFPSVSIIDHKTIFEGYHQYLPTFNSMSIESLLYKIPSLSECFLYLNDDFFLTRETKKSDFFINGKPVLRGKWTSFYEDIWYKKIQYFIYNLIGKKEKLNAFGFKKSQQLIVKKLGFKKYVRLDHTITSLRKSTFKTYYQENLKMLESNIKHRFRNSNQYVPQSLANHLEIKNNTFVLKKDYQLVYFQNYKKPFFWIKYKLRKAVKDNNKLFLCLQSLDQCPDEKLSFIKKWLSNKYD